MEEKGGEKESGLSRKEFWNLKPLSILTRLSMKGE